MNDPRTRFKPIPGVKAVDYFESTWLFYIDTKGDNSTRLISRFRNDYSAGMRNNVSFGYFVVAISSTMQQQMLRNIKKRAKLAMGLTDGG